MTFVLGLGPTRNESLVGYSLRCGTEVARSDNLGARYGRLAEREGRGRRGPVITLPSVSPPCDPEKRAKDKSLSEKEREAGAGAADVPCVSASTLIRAPVAEAALYFSYAEKHMHEEQAGPMWGWSSSRLCAETAFLGRGSLEAHGGGTVDVCSGF